MRRPDKKDGKASRVRRPKSPRRRKAPKDLLRRQRDEALEQQAATAEILSVISNSPTDTQPVFDAIVQSGLKLFPHALISIALRNGDMFKIAAIAERDPDRAEAWRRTSPSPLTREYMHGIAILDRKTVDIADVRKASLETPTGAQKFLTSGYRAITIVPMMCGGDAIGALSVVRLAPGPLSDKQLAVLKTFAAQAVIAIENTRLLNELRQRTDDLSESLEQQTATSEVLKVISSTPGELEPVFTAMLDNAVRICEATFGALFLFEGDVWRAVALHAAAPSSFIEARQRHPMFPIIPGTALGRVAATKQVVQIADVRAEPAYLDSSVRLGIETGDIRTVLSVPMLKEAELVGAFNLFHQEVRQFTDKQIELVQSFAAQAVIAIENTRLLNELRESLQQQTATADVLKVISRSTFDLQAVFKALVDSAAQLCRAKMANIALLKEDAFIEYHAAYGFEPDYMAYIRSHKLKADRGSVMGRAVLEARTVHIHDVLADSEYATGPGSRWLLDAQKRGGFRTVLGVPLLREGKPVGAMFLTRDTVEPFTQQQIELVTTFATQAVIAIENTRLLNELRQRTDDLTDSLEQQTATSEVLRVISSSPGELEPVFETVLKNAVRLCEAKFGFVCRYEGDVFRVMSQVGAAPAYMEYVRKPFRTAPETILGQMLSAKRTIQIPDLAATPGYAKRIPLMVAAVELGGVRTYLATPMFKENEIIGAILLYRQEVRPFTDRQIELVKNFADQAAIAIENVRLFDEVQGRTRELAKSLEDLRTTQDRLVQTQKLALLGQLTAGIAHEIKNPLNFVNNFSGISAELIDELQDTLKGIALDDKARTEINELTGTLKSNFDKVVHHGRRADAIVKNMLQHSREGTGEHRAIDINALVEESLNLAWHGARAETQGFEIKLKQSFDPSAGEADIFPQDIRRALLNMISNGFYAASRRRAETNGGDYEPTLTASTKNLGDRVEIRIRDNGTGMPPDVKEKMFNPFFTTKPTGEGTGLGLSISHDIIVKQHGGSIEVDTQPGEFTEIRVVLPRVAALLPERS